MQNYSSYSIITDNNGTATVTICPQQIIVNSFVPGIADNFRPYISIVQGQNAYSSSGSFYPGVFNTQINNIVGYLPDSVKCQFLSS